MPSPFDFRQLASAFNQPLSFDTSSVTNMDYMFWVRSSPCPTPNLHSRALSCTLPAPRSPAASPACRPACLAPHGMPSFRPSAARVGVQPVAELRHLQRRGHEPHVLGALLPVPCSHICNRAPPLHVACTAVARRLPPPSPHVVPHRMPSVRLSAVRVGVQPAAELRHLQRHGDELHVRGALLPVPRPQSAVEPSPARCLHCGRPPPPACRPVYLAPHCIPFIRPSAARVIVQPAAEL